MKNCLKRLALGCALTFLSNSWAYGADGERCSLFETLSVEHMICLYPALSEDLTEFQQARAALAADLKDEFVITQQHLKMRKAQLNATNKWFDDVLRPMISDAAYDAFDCLGAACPDVAMILKIAQANPIRAAVEKEVAAIERIQAIHRAYFPRAISGIYQ